MLACTQMRHRRKMMFTKFLGEMFNGSYLVLSGGLSGGLAAWIAGTGGLVQALTPDHHLKKTIWPRIIGAVILSALSLYLAYKNPFDLLPLVAVTFCRFMELHHNPERIRLAYYVSGFPWMLYLYVNEIYFMLGSVAVMNIMFLIGLLRHRPRKVVNIDQV
jgi:hypothetical protein